MREGGRECVREGREVVRRRDGGVIARGEVGGGGRECVREGRKRRVVARGEEGGKVRAKDREGGYKICSSAMRQCIT